jgi:tRNA C32,U32 (ribose-2'-O)-methylase TrmJ
MSIDITLTVSFDTGVLGAIDRLISAITSATPKDDKIMIMLKDILDKVTAESTDIASLTAFIQGLEDRLKAIPGMPADMQIQIDQLFSEVDKNDKAILDAMHANVPPVV